MSSYMSAYIATVFKEECEDRADCSASRMRVARQRIDSEVERVQATTHLAGSREVVIGFYGITVTVPACRSIEEEIDLRESSLVQTMCSEQLTPLPLMKELDIRIHESSKLPCRPSQLQAFEGIRTKLQQLNAVCAPTICSRWLQHVQDKYDAYKQELFRTFHWG